MIDSSQAARLVLTEAAALEPILRRTPDAAFDLPTGCPGWSVRDVLAHCAAAMHRVSSGDPHRFTPEDNQADVDARRDWPLPRLLDELLTGFPLCAKAIEEGGGRWDKVALGVWVHGGDVRGPLGARDAYTSAGLDLALALFERFATGLPSVRAELPDRVLHLGPPSATPARVVTDVETLVRLLAGRDPNPARFHTDVDPAVLTVFR
ncbi:MAG TPA: maleylpyruvate isomerase family mycothiol-dependent enzyme [Pseudonocardiaceae bacterium]